MALDNDIERLAKMITELQRVVIFTGAGVSTESGIPDFRSPGGLWDRYDIEEFYFQRFMNSEKSRILYWKMQSELYHLLRQVGPNSSHYACVDLHDLGQLDRVITQNIDNLHQVAGLSGDKVIELHGNATKVKCMSCGRFWPREDVQKRLDQGDKAPLCNDCKGYLKPATISFGQPMPVDAMQQAEYHSRNCDLFIAMGSSLVVQPAATMPLLAKEGGAKLAIVNLEKTPYHGEADLVVLGKTGEVMSRVVSLVKKSMKHS
jgi:NAD-dependent deacetylase